MKTFRPLGAFNYKDNIYLYYQSSANESITFSIAKSTDGIHFEPQSNKGEIIIFNTKKEHINDCAHFNLSLINEKVYLTYKHIKNVPGLYIASSDDLIHFSSHDPYVSCREIGIIVPQVQYKEHSVMYTGEHAIRVAFSKDLLTWKLSEKPVLEQRPTRFDEGSLEVEQVMETEKGIILIYHAKTGNIRKKHYTVGVALFDKKNPQKLLWRSKDPLWETRSEWSVQDCFPIGTIRLKERIISYWSVKGEGLYAVVYSFTQAPADMPIKNISLRLNKSSKNPILSPKKESYWEAFNTFNPAAVYEAGKVHILYRAQGHNYVSVLGYASSRDGVHIDERLEYPVFTPPDMSVLTQKKKSYDISSSYMSAGYGGCEDPRITKIGNRFYMTYVAYDGWSAPRVALTSISVEDFLNHRWLWETPVIISPPEVVDKNACILPEKIKGKYVIFHRIYPHILIDYVDTLEFDGTTWLKGEYKISPQKGLWDSRKVGAGAPPLKTKAGWLLIYQAVGEMDAGKYKIGAMLLDLENPTQVLHRTKAPILEPTERYENEGFKAGVAYPCGAVIIDNTLFVYYGGADSVVCVATTPLDEFLHELQHDHIVMLERAFIHHIKTI